MVTWSGRGVITQTKTLMLMLGSLRRGHILDFSQESKTKENWYHGVITERGKAALREKKGPGTVDKRLHEHTRVQGDSKFRPTTMWWSNISVEYYDLTYHNEEEHAYKAHPKKLRTDFIKLC